MKVTGTPNFRHEKSNINKSYLLCLQEKQRWRGIKAHTHHQVISNIPGTIQNHSAPKKIRISEY